MTSWLWVAPLAYFLSAIVAVVDKFLVTEKIREPISYAFYIGILSFFVIIFIPFGFYVPPLKTIALSLSSGILFLAGSVLLYKALFKNETSRVITVIGGLTPVFTFLASFMLLQERLDWHHLSAFIALLAGSVLISMDKEGLYYKIKGFQMVVGSALLLSLSYVLSKFVYTGEPFTNGFIWIRLGSFIAALFLLLSRKNRRLIFQTSENLKTDTSLTLLGNKALAGISFMILNFAFATNSVTIVNAVQGIQYAFLFLITIFLSYKFPHILKERISKEILLQKIVAILLIGAGLIILSV